MKRLRCLVLLTVLLLGMGDFFVGAKERVVSQGHSDAKNRGDCREQGTCSLEDGPKDSLVNTLLGLYQSAGSTAGRFLLAYTTLLEQHPLITKSVTSGIVGGLGDVTAQLLERYWKVSALNLDLGRSLTIAAEGLLISGPLLHLAYNWMDEHIDLEKVFGESDASKWMRCALQVTFDMLIMDSIFVATLMVTSAILQGRYNSVRHELRFDYLPAVRVSWLSSFSMTPLQFLNFAYIPVQFRVLITNLEDVVWNAAVSYMAHKSRR